MGETGRKWKNGMRFERTGRGRNIVKEPGRDCMELTEDWGYEWL